MSGPAIRLERLCKSYGRQRGIDGVDLQVARGEVCGYLGPNGAGKTTTIRVLMGFIRADGGRAEMLGREVRRGGAPLRGRLGYMPGELALYGNLTGRQLLRFIAALHGRRDGAARADELGQRLGGELDRPLQGLSQGNRRKIGLIRAFMLRPELVILDEPTSGLDPLVRQEFYGLVAEARAAGQSVFLSSHNLAEVERVCDRVAIIRAGRIVAVEAVGELKARALRQVTIRFRDRADASLVASLANVSVLECAGSQLRCQVRGDMDEFVKTVARAGVSDFLSHEPELEDIFLSYYGGGTDAGQPVRQDPA